MEEDSVEFLKKVSWSIFLGFVWLMINIGVAMYNGWVVPENGLEWKHIIFYIWAVLSTLLMLRKVKQIWKK